ncbi:hypothetical protein QBC32DRAFT_389577 [Pseudoneurospora amorphoporcata]|uniref:Uncharacterized protein n=1 Tax=Pseudoneurospora amorphoporcata TaxID=241081 RepID=A0AAN6NYX9_9PEZI|nr:hypothetical protein QBC32DRAFT_389577 [Pseudoneurospora amorphoporcata]
MLSHTWTQAPRSVLHTLHGCHKPRDILDAKHHLGSFFCFLHCPPAFTGPSMQRRIISDSALAMCLSSQTITTTNQLFGLHNHTNVYTFPFTPWCLGFLFSRRGNQPYNSTGLQAFHFNTSIRSSQQTKPNQKKKKKKKKSLSFVASPYVNPLLSAPFTRKPFSHTLLYALSPLAVNEHDERIPCNDQNLPVLRYPLLFFCTFTGFAFFIFFFLHGERDRQTTHWDLGRMIMFFFFFLFLFLWFCWLDFRALVPIHNFFFFSSTTVHATACSRNHVFLGGRYYTQRFLF